MNINLQNEEATEISPLKAGSIAEHCCGNQHYFKESVFIQLF